MCQRAFSSIKCLPIHPLKSFLCTGVLRWSYYRESYSKHSEKQRVFLFDFSWEQKLGWYVWYFKLRWQILKLAALLIMLHPTSLYNNGWEQGGRDGHLVGGWSPSSRWCCVAYWRRQVMGKEKAGLLTRHFWQFKSSVFCSTGTLGVDFGLCNLQPFPAWANRDWEHRLRQAGMRGYSDKRTNQVT